ncbi:uncharacterized protein BP5553_01870 [Venustampulla echinocandica]|uniref:Uncharacterized protein n=1 Tax=Venustampulla echinocandica TaxID=2656787 RepID=A0A370U299_9HELO|nr:uncharacterized protein BP5553_01870 [Venustampulla echinocandica]RDL41891.1 hypothetical protein BP5553_01870 [Venustampulla echinocandica]
MSVGLHDLPGELLSLILQQVDSPSHLHNLLVASAPCYRIFSSRRERVLSSVLQNAICVEAVHDALAVIGAPRFTQLSKHPTREDVTNFLKSYHSTPFQFPTDFKSLCALSHLLTIVEHFVTAFSTQAHRALETLGKPYRSLPRWAWPPAPSSCRIEVALPLSVIERARLQRAFFRFELYCRIFPQSSSRGVSLFPRADQSRLFLSRLSPWEIDEINCVHQYLSSLVGVLVDELEDQLVGTVLSATGMKHTTPSTSTSRGSLQRIVGARHSNSPFPRDRIADPGFGNISHLYELGDHEFVMFTTLDLCGLDVFSENEKYHQEGYISFMCSYGIGFIYNLLLSENDRRRHLILSHTPVQRDFFPEAVEIFYPEDNSPVIEQSQDETASSSNPGWKLVTRGDVDRKFYFGTQRAHLRDKGYVFWDAKRFQLEGLGKKIKDTMNMSQVDIKRLYQRSAKQSVEDRLEHIRIPGPAWRSIIANFSLRYPD